MQYIDFKVRHQTITRTDNYEVVGYSQNYLYARFDFCEEWAGLTATAVFSTNSGKHCSAAIENGECMVPWEVLCGPEFWVGVFAGDRITTSTARVPVKPSVKLNASPGVQPSPSAYEALVGRVESALSQAPVIGENNTWVVGGTDTGVYATGPRGEKGEQGPQGTQGPVGATGPKGEKGDKGDTGPQGETGATGPQGEKGDKGDQGEKGDKGDTGATGPKGDKGDTGAGFKVLDYYASVAALEAAVPTPNVGDAYGVGTEDPYDIYIYGEASGWVNNGPIQGAKGEDGQKTTRVLEIVLLASNWVNNRQTVECEGIKDDELSQTVTVASAVANEEAYANAGVACIGFANDSLTFSASSTPTIDLSVCVAIEEAGATGETGADGITPHIGENNNWWIGEIDTGVKAKGEDGQDGYTPVKGVDYFDGQDGQDGNGIQSIERTDGDGSAGTMDTYTINMTDGSTTQFTVYNGKDGTNGSGGVAGVSSFNGRTGEVTPQAGDYTAAMVGASAEGHGHSASELTDGTFAVRAVAHSAQQPPSLFCLRNTKIYAAANVASATLSNDGSIIWGCE